MMGYVHPNRSSDRSPHLFSAPLPDRPARARLGWLTAARGIGIVLVVFAHCLRGLEAAGIVPPTPAVQMLDRLIYAFHMPLFFLLSGMTFEVVADRHRPAAFLRDRVIRLLWPLTLWTWVFFAFRAAALGHGNAQTGWADIPLIPLPPQAHFWFLWALFVIGITLYLARWLWQRLVPGREMGFWLLALAATLVLSLTVPVPDMLAVWLVPATLYAPCLVLGVLVARLLPAHPPGAAIMLLAALTFPLMLVIAAQDDSRAAVLLVALIAPLALLYLLRGAMVGRAGSARAGSGWLNRLGQDSMAIFLTHTIFSAGLRIGLMQLGIDDPALHLVLGTAIGLIGPLALAALVRRLGLVRLAGF